MTIDHFRELVAGARFPIRIRARDREYGVDRPEGLMVEPRVVRVCRNGFDIVLSLRDIDQVLDASSSR